MLRRLVVLVENLADDLLEQILHRHEARRAAVLVEHDRHVLLESLEVGEHLFDLARAGHDVHRPHDRRAARTSSGVRAQHRDQVLREHEPDDVVDRLLVDRIARPPALLDDRQRLVERRVDGSASISVRGVITSRAFFSENSNTPSSRSASWASSTPPSWLCSTSMRSSSGECTLLPSVCALWPKQPQHELRRGVRADGERPHQPREHEQRRRQPARERSGCVSATRLRRQLAEHDVEDT